MDYIVYDSLVTQEQHNDFIMWAKELSYDEDNIPLLYTSYVHYPRYLIENGMIPNITKDEEKLPLLNQKPKIKSFPRFLIAWYEGASDAELVYWFSRDSSHAQLIKSWFYASKESRVKKALETASSWYLIFNYKELLYHGEFANEEIWDITFRFWGHLIRGDLNVVGIYTGSKRPINNMDLYRNPLSYVLKYKDFIKAIKDTGKVRYYGVDYNIIPVTRYGKGMTRGLYYGEQADVSYCGTFYYFEPESTTYLMYNTNIETFNKVTAMYDLFKLIGVKYEIKTRGDIVSDMLYVPNLESLYERKKVLDKNPHLFDTKSIMDWQTLMLVSSDEPDEILFSLKMLRYGYLYKYIDLNVTGLTPHYVMMAIWLYDVGIMRGEHINQNLMFTPENIEKLDLILSATSYRVRDILNTYHPDDGYLVNENMRRLLKEYHDAIELDAYLTPDTTGAVDLTDAKYYLRELRDRMNEIMKKFPNEKEYNNFANRYYYYDMGLYAFEDIYDQPLCKMAKILGIEVIILKNMIGSYQVVTEVLDTRDRLKSLDSLVFVA